VFLNKCLWSIANHEIDEHMLKYLIRNKNQWDHKITLDVLLMNSLLFISSFDLKLKSSQLLYYLTKWNMCLSFVHYVSLLIKSIHKLNH